MSAFVNIHIHGNHDLKNISIQSRFIEDIKSGDKSTNPYSTGIHPWNINKINVKDQLRVLAYMARSPIVCAIGECGIDRSIPISLERQIEIFEAHIRIANHSNNPLIIHNVRAFSDFLFLIKKNLIHSPWIFHAYTGNLRIAKEFIKHGAYLSFGHHLLHNNSKASEVFKEIPLENIFLETDDWDGSIEQIYLRAAEIKEIPLNELREVIFLNYQKVFKNISH
ncbi:MAG: TatD family hydrolase [Bacteroidales bacterium]|nr:TatD family hydrolase [Bacteroidales bacterium]